MSQGSVHALVRTGVGNVSHRTMGIHPHGLKCYKTMGLNGSVFRCYITDTDASMSGNSGTAFQQEIARTVV